MKIADISHYQGVIDWSKARKELDFAIFRASLGSDTKDKKYLYNTAECGIPYGAYHYVMAGTPEKAKEEAQFFFKTANEAIKKPLFYIADIEYKAQTAETTEAVCKAFLLELHNLGCKKIGMYINTRYNWAGKAIKMCDIMWIPHWGLNDGKIPADKYKPQHYNDLWQYTSKGRVDGIKGDVDLNLINGSKKLSWFIDGWDYSEPKLGDRVLQVGSIGNDVKTLQSLLNKTFGFKLVVDGEYGSKTRTGVKKMEKACGILVDGVYDQQAHKAFMAYIDSLSAKKLVVTQATNCCNGDSETYNIIAFLAAGTKVEPIYDKEKNYIVSAAGWYAVKCENQIGWIDSKYIKEG